MSDPQTKDQRLPPHSLTDEDFAIISSLHKRWLKLRGKCSATQYRHTDQIDADIMCKAQHWRHADKVTEPLRFQGSALPYWIAKGAEECIQVGGAMVVYL